MSKSLDETTLSEEFYLHKTRAESELGKSGRGEKEYSRKRQRKNKQGIERSSFKERRPELF